MSYQRRCRQVHRLPFPPSCRAGLLRTARPRPAASPTATSGSSPSFSELDAALASWAHVRHRQSGTHAGNSMVIVGTRSGGCASSPPPASARRQRFQLCGQLTAHLPARCSFEGATTSARMRGRPRRARARTEDPERAAQWRPVPQATASFDANVVSAMANACMGPSCPAAKSRLYRSLETLPNMSAGALVWSPV